MRKTEREAAEVTGVPTTGIDAHLGAMMYLAVLAYPESTEKRDRLIEHMKLWLAKVAVQKTPSLRAKMPAKLTWTRLRKHEEMLLTKAASKRLDNCHLAGEMAARKFFDGQKVGPLILKIKNKSVADHYREVGSTRYSEESDYRSEVWHRFLPVVHLAMTYPCDAEGYRPAFDLVHKPDWLYDALLGAESLRRAQGEKIPAFKSSQAVSLIPIK